MNKENINEEKSDINGYKELPLNGKSGGVAIVSNEDFEELSKHKWYMHKKGYIHGTVNRKKIKMHHFILEQKEGMVVDHINGIRHDNRRSNLRYLSKNKNSQNLHLKKENTSSKYRGVSYNKTTEKFNVQIRINNVRNYLGRYISEIEAAEVYDMYIVHNNLDHIELNFPEKRNEYNSRTYIPYKKNENNKSVEYTGVSQLNEKYNVYISHKNKTINIGIYNDLIEAANKYDEYVVKNDILEKKLNFPEKYPEYIKKRIIRTQCEIIDDNTVKLLINNHDNDGKPITIDKADYEKVKYFKCSITNSKYVHIDTKEKSLLLSRFLCEVTETSIYVDHIDSNTFNNTRKNLRISDCKKNAQNKEKMNDATSKYYGVSYHKFNNRWVAYVAHDNQAKYRKVFEKEELAARARDLYILENIDDPHYKFNYDWNDEDKILWKQKLDAISDNYDNKFSSKYNGVCYNKKTDKWIITIKKNQKNVHSKTFTDEIYAAKYRDIWLLAHYEDDVKNGKYKLNFDWSTDDILKWKSILKFE